MALRTWLFSSCFSRYCKHSSNTDSSRPLRENQGEWSWWHSQCTLLFRSQTMLNISCLTCWGQSGWQWCCSSLWLDAHIHEPEKHPTPQGPGSSLKRYCRSLQHSLCCFPTTVAAESGSPGEGSVPLSYRKSHLRASGGSSKVQYLLYTKHFKLRYF